MEGYPSGRRGLIANELVWGNLERGFKSLTLRQNKIRRIYSSEIIFKEGPRDYEVSPSPSAIVDRLPP